MSNNKVLKILGKVIGVGLELLVNSGVSAYDRNENSLDDEYDKLLFAKNHLNEEDPQDYEKIQLIDKRLQEIQNINHVFNDANKFDEMENFINRLKGEE